MPRLRHLAPLALLAATNAARADLSAEDVWQDWQTYIASFGYQITGTTERDGDTLVVSDAMMQTAGDTPGETSELRLDRLTFTETDDGSVRVGLPSEIPFTVSRRDPESGETTLDMVYRHEGFDLVATGTPAEMRYTYDAPSLTLETRSVTRNGAPVSDSKITVEVMKIDGTTDMRVEETRIYEQSLSIGEIRADVQASAPEGEEMIELSFGATPVNFTGQSSLPLAVVAANDMDAMLGAGFAIEGRFSLGESGAMLEGTGARGPMAAAIAAEEGTLDVSMTAAGLSYALEQNEVAAQMRPPGVPIPLAFNLAQSIFRMDVPVQATDAPGPIGLEIGLRDMIFPDTLWNLFDPQAQLPRDPAQAELSISGTARLLSDVPGPAAPRLSGPAQMEIDTASIDRLSLEIAGAALTGTGAFAFETDAGRTTRPTGGIDLELTGGNALIDTLVGIGILPEQQAMAARMMLGLLAVPGDAPDTLTSRIEINEEGHVSANGQRIQ